MKTGFLLRKGQLLETVTQAERDFFKVINLFDIGDRVAAHTAERPAVSQIYLCADTKAQAFAAVCFVCVAAGTVDKIVLRHFYVVAGNTDGAEYFNQAEVQKVVDDVNAVSAQRHIGFEAVSGKDNVCRGVFFMGRLLIEAFDRQSGQNFDAGGQDVRIGLVFESLVGIIAVTGVGIGIVNADIGVEPAGGLRISSRKGEKQRKGK